MPPNPNSPSPNPTNAQQAPDTLTRYQNLTLGTSAPVRTLTDSIKAEINTALQNRGSSIPNAPQGLFSTNGSVTKIEASTPEEVKNAALALVRTHITSQTDTTHTGIMSILNAKIGDLETAVTQQATATNAPPAPLTLWGQVKSGYWTGFNAVNDTVFQPVNNYFLKPLNRFLQYFDPTHKKFWVNDAMGTKNDK